MESNKRRRYKETIRKLVNKMTVNNLEIGSTCMVDITYVNSPQSFFVRPRGYTPYMPIIQARGEHLQKYDISIGDTIIYRSRILLQNVRGRIMTVQGILEPTYDVFAVDVGCYEKAIPLKKIWSLYYPAELPSLVTHCQLANCTPLGHTWDNRAIEAMRNYVLGERAKIVITCKTSDAVIVKVYNSCPEEVGAMLALTGYTSPGQPREICKRPHIKSLDPPFSFPSRRLYLKTIMHVRMQYGKIHQRFHVAPLTEYLTYLDDQNDLMAYAKKQNALKYKELSLNSPVGIISTNTKRFERGIMKQLHTQNNQATVLLSDWGKEVDEPLCNLRPLPDKCLSIPAKVIYCRLHESQFYDKLLNRFSDPGMEFFITIEEIGQHGSANAVTIAPLVGNTTF